MKTLCKTIRLLVLAGTAAVLTVTGFAQGKPNGVTIQDQKSSTQSPEKPWAQRIIIHPGTKLQSKDEAALNNVLSKYDKKLYRVEKYKDGKLTGTVGDLKLDKQTASEVANAKGSTHNVHREAGLTDSTVIIVAGSTKQVPSRAATTDESAKALIKILKKYSASKP